MKKLNKITRITLIVIGTFSVMIVMSLITSAESVILLFGDIKCDVQVRHYGYSNYYGTHWHYSWTHWLYIAMGASLAFIQLFRIAEIAEEK